MAIVRRAVEAEMIAWGGIEPTRIFLVTRSRDGFDPTSDALRVRLDASYERLVQASASVALRVSNDAPLSETLNVVKSQVDLAIGGTLRER